jgi:hypothetical protein
MSCEDEPTDTPNFPDVTFHFFALTSQFDTYGSGAGTREQSTPAMVQDEHTYDVLGKGACWATTDAGQYAETMPCVSRYNCP